jgi:hypothetical protein
MLERNLGQLPSARALRRPALALEAAGGLCHGQGVDNVDRGGEEHRMSIQAGGVAQRDRQMRLAKADIDEVQTKQVLDLWPVDLRLDLMDVLVERLRPDEFLPLGSRIRAPCTRAGNA